MDTSILRLLLVAAVAAPVASSRLRRSSSAADATSARQGRGGHGEAAAVGDDGSCGPLASYPNARPKNFADAQGTYYNSTAKKTMKKVYEPGDSIEFECLPGFTTDGSKEGSTTFQVLCGEFGYYKPGGVCLEGSKCGALPEIPHAVPTGKDNGDNVEMSCADGYSLDGEEVVAGGLGKNQLFTLKCIEFSGEYEKFTGECKPYSFVPATEAAQIYNKVFEALFVVSCKGTLKKAFGAGNGPGVDKACSKFVDSTLQGKCEGLVSKIKSDFTAQQAARKTHDDTAGKEWYEEKDAERPGINDEAHEFCTELWKLLEYTQ